MIRCGTSSLSLLGNRSNHLLLNPGCLSLTLQSHIPALLAQNRYQGTKTKRQSSAESAQKNSNLNGRKQVEVNVEKHREKLPYKHKLIDVNKHRGMDMEFGHHDLVLDDITSEENQAILQEIEETKARVFAMVSKKRLRETEAAYRNIPEESRRVGLVMRKIGMMPQWTVKGRKILCTVLKLEDNQVVDVLSPDAWYRTCKTGKVKAFGRMGPTWRVGVGAKNDNPFDYDTKYREIFDKAQVPCKEYVKHFMVSEDSLPPVGVPLDVRHFQVGQWITVSGKSIYWGFQGVVHRWGMKGQPKLRTTKSHRRVGSIGTKGDAKVHPGRALPGPMGGKWVMMSGLQILRMNVTKQCIWVMGNVPGEAGTVLLVKDCVQPLKKLQYGPVPTWTPKLEADLRTQIEEGSVMESGGEVENENEEAVGQEQGVKKISKDWQLFHPALHRVDTPSISYTEKDIKKSIGRDKTKAKLAKVKK
ncbi:hypothetical protein WR25_19106 [Diploscapter pachys]|uniref:Large ribosomal subunit protein uL3m n=1 Tax=Diploscapter pachys TaxID=2018661 RepID=A0A2A2L2Z5_9BILA|nr:hypothetical protein WR25_19106 [Diploscapter pachys]